MMLTRPFFRFSRAMNNVEFVCPLRSTSNKITKIIIVIIIIIITIIIIIIIIVIIIYYL